MHITFLGTRANDIMDMLHINARNCVFEGFAELLPLWRNALTVSQEVAGLRSESLLLYAFSVLGDNLLCTETREKRNGDSALVIKKYIDDHFSDYNLSGTSWAGLFLHSKMFRSIYGCAPRAYMNKLAQTSKNKTSPME